MSLVVILCFTLLALVNIGFIYYRFVTNKKINYLIDQLNLFNNQLKKENHFIDEYIDEKIPPIEKLKSRIEDFINQRQNEVDHINKLEQYRKEYLGNVAHELKTPIFNIQGYIATLAEGGIYDENINMAYINRAEKNVTRMITIIDDLDAITQLESGHLILDIEKFDIRILAKEVFESLELSAKKKNIVVRFNREYINPVYVYADRHRIRQVLANLLTNSIKYSPENGVAEISFIKIKDQVEIFVRDTGIGIGPEHLPRLFERFYRIDKGRSREQGGTGLGLAIVKHIIEAHESTIAVSSKVGGGTSFRFLLKGDLV